MFEDDYFIGEHRRNMQNYEGYSELLKGAEPVSEELHPLLEHFEKGTALPDEILTIAVNTRIPSFEVGRVTSPYGKRLEHVEPFRQDVRNAIEAHGGVVFPTIQGYRSIDINPKVTYDTTGEGRIVGFIVTYKRDVGAIELPNDSGVISIVERQVAGFRVDEASGFPQEILEKMHLAMKDPGTKWDGEKDLNWHEELLATGCLDFIETAVQTDSLEDFVVPQSTTIYGFKEEFSVRQRMARFAAKFSTRRVVDNRGIAYVGPEN